MKTFSSPSQSVTELEKTTDLMLETTEEISDIEELNRTRGLEDDAMKQKILLMFQ
jgi:hypothetical protein